MYWIEIADKKEEEEDEEEKKVETGIMGWTSFEFFWEAIWQSTCGVHCRKEGIRLFSTPRLDVKALVLVYK
ncbi:hypothetical protein N7462_007901 [Penicillium macrosclerotiorum]|uniref:uncharacterized protein n=1 Tax=Penicillium macrosclerotiorum TaxID=303699 RepID=UPI002547B6EE|nr:uncharacterized protein N7462_007901 [Penicillium macrosclerotiorum]KAJ5679657.1 hypothetical protein N7462_007901 [Penicillium macrosclerotiorum]